MTSRTKQATAAARVKRPTVKNSDATFHNVWGQLAGKDLINKQQGPKAADVTIDPSTAKAGDVERFTGAPYLAPLRRLDETQAARKPKLTWRPDAAGVAPAPLAAE